MKLTGTWEGKYSYNPEEHGVIDSVGFRISMSESWLHKITGYVQDVVEDGGTPDRGRIIGKRKGKLIRFAKTIPVSYVRSEEGIVEAQRAIEEAVGGEVLGGMPEHVIHYQGIIDRSREEVTGDWILQPSIIETTKGMMESSGGSGTWEMRRVSRELDQLL